MDMSNKSENHEDDDFVVLGKWKLTVTDPMWSRIIQRSFCPFQNVKFELKINPQTPKLAFSTIPDRAPMRKIIVMGQNDQYAIILTWVRMVRVIIRWLMVHGYSREVLKPRAPHIFTLCQSCSYSSLYGALGYEKKSDLGSGGVRGPFLL